MVRQAAVHALDAWVEQTKLTPFVEDGVFAESLRIENPFLRSTVSLNALCTHYDKPIHVHSTVLNYCI